MAPLLFSFNQNKRTTLSTLFLLTFLGAVATVALPCPSKDRRKGGSRLEAERSIEMGKPIKIVVLSEEERKAEMVKMSKRYGFLDESRGR
ncbi:hypothetical protein BDY24DRAFT_404728 [Mrakia frigida]|uniref:uncharacterized protein n=1 Tax=Mrakia frigida TaxID=29902 RepID=UPI003FCC164A